MADKLRVGCCSNLDYNHLHNSSSLLQPFYDPSIMSSNLLTCTNFQHGVKEERMNLMGYISSCSSHNFNMDPQSSLHINPTHIQDLNNTNTYNSNHHRVLDQSFNGVLSSGQGLSLSLSSQQTYQNSAPLSLNLQRLHEQPYDMSRSSVPLGPFTGYSSILKGSRFLNPVQKMLEEICDVGRRNFQTEDFTADTCLLDTHPLHSLSRSGISDDDDPRSSGQQGRKKSKLLSMLDEVCKRYRQYYQQIQAVVTSFESVAGLSCVAPFVNLALRAMSKHFMYLKNAINDQLQFTFKSYSQVNYGKDGIPRTQNADTSIYGQKPVQNIGFVEHQPVWRTQRGLPEHAVSVLRAWLFEHFLHPYPTDTEKLMLAKQIGLSRNQVSNWFINARVRLWKPMVEEIHNLEIRQKPSHPGEQNSDKTNNHLPAADSVRSEIAFTSTQRVHEFPSKRSRDDYSNNVITDDEEPTNLFYGNTLRHQHIGVGMNGATGTNGVSLTLGLHQNNGIGMTEPFAMNAARRFGIDANEGFIMGTFEEQNRQLGRDYTGGQLLHDFVA